ncbi:MAG: transglycosylase domain-containing protein [Clostridiales Family XIII bacterium]|nr:transglycosylase domain-containing protein [Clostridiales Family XIII bacterium]
MAETKDFYTKLNELDAELKDGDQPKASGQQKTGDQQKAGGQPRTGGHQKTSGQPKEDQVQVVANRVARSKQGSKMARPLSGSAQPPSPPMNEDIKTIWTAEVPAEEEVEMGSTSRSSSDKRSRGASGSGTSRSSVPKTGSAKNSSQRSTSQKSGSSGRRPPDNGRKPTAIAAANNKNRKRKRKSHTALKTIILVFAVIFLIGIAAGTIYVYSALRGVTEVDPATIADKLWVSSTIYDDEGEPIKNIYLGDGERTMCTFEQFPENLTNAFIAIEDKTFWEHHGFNFIRIAGAIKESITDGGGVSGTSTITQQLARNIWLKETMSDRDMTRKLREAYYAVQLENALSKEEILTDYLNTISLGYHSYGVQAAAQAYFDKDVEQLDLLECAALASLPKGPSEYAMVGTVNKGTISIDDPRLLLVGERYDYIYNDKVEPRVRLVLDNMLDQGLITEAEHRAARNQSLRAHLHPRELSGSGDAAFFVDYAIDQVANDLLVKGQFGLKDKDEALQMVYGGGLEIYSTLHTAYQSIIIEEFENQENFPAVEYSRNRVASGDLVNENNVVMLYAMKNMFAEDGTFTFAETEYSMLEDGSLLLRAHPDYLKDEAGNSLGYPPSRLNLYPTVVDGLNDVSIEFKDIYEIAEDDILYIIKGGVINIPQGYKTMDEAGNCIISKTFFDEYERAHELLVTDGSGISVPVTSYTLKQRIIQPQAAMVLLEHDTGQLKAMAGGRNVSGEMNFNRATGSRQPGSTIKPISVYGPALQMGYEGQPVGGNGEASYGTYWTPLSVIVDAKFEYNGDVWPKNFYSGYRGPMTLRTAVEQSVNVTAVKVQLNVGADRSTTFMKKLGITTLVESGDTNDMNPAALALGGMTNGIKPIEITSAYGTFAAGGTHVDPISYTKVTKRSGEVLLDGTPKSAQVMDPGVAFIMNDILHTTVTQGIGSYARVSGVPVAGKTGTTSDNYDIWFVGNTPKYSAGIWVGDDVNIRLSTTSTKAAALWSKIMTRIMEGQDPGEFSSAPTNVQRVTVSGLSDYVIIGTAPEKIIFGSEEVAVCNESGYLATPWCSLYAVYQFNPFANPEEPQEPNTIIGQAPEFYCWMHNQAPGQYPIDPGHGGPIWSPPPPPPPEPDPIPPVIPPSTSSGGVGPPSP